MTEDDDIDETERERRSPAFAEVTRIFGERERVAARAAAEMGGRQQQFIFLAIACYGPRWQTDAARALGVSDRTVRAYASGRTAVSEGVLADMRAVAEERQRFIAAAISRSRGEDAPEDPMEAEAREALLVHRRNLLGRDPMEGGEWVVADERDRQMHYASLVAAWRDTLRRRGKGD